MKYCPAASARIGRRAVPTPGSTTTTCTAPFGTCRSACAISNAPSTISNGVIKHVITTSIEHHAVLKACEQLEAEGVEVSRLSPWEDVRGALRPETVLISVMHANNETGAVQPIESIAQIAREAGVLLHSDGVQAAGKIPVDVRALGVD